MMIMGVAGRVVPILAGVDTRRLSNLWGPFLLITVGASGRVLLQIATDFYPNVAYPLVGLTGFVEVAALAGAAPSFLSGRVCRRRIRGCLRPELDARRCWAVSRFLPTCPMLS